MNDASPAGGLPAVALCAEAGPGGALCAGSPGGAEGDPERVAPRTGAGFDAATAGDADGGPYLSTVALGAEVEMVAARTGVGVGAGADAGAVATRAGADPPAMRSSIETSLRRWIQRSSAISR